MLEKEILIEKNKTMKSEFNNIKKLNYKTMIKILKF